MTNLLIALKNIVENPNNDLVAQYHSLNRMNSMGEALEFYIKDIFSGAFSEKDLSKREQKYSKEFSYLGNQNNPPDIIIKSGDAIEVKKHIGIRAGGLALNSSYPKDYLYSNSPMITAACRDCEEWTKKDLIYIVGSIVDNKIKSLWFVYGNCYAASREVYEKIKNAITQGVNSLPDIEFGETNELGRVNKVDPLGITDLRIRGMWAIKHPGRVFDYLQETIIDADFKVNALMLTSKYDSFPKADKENLEKLASKNLLVKDVQIKSPNNPAKFLEAKLIRFTK
jgi:hypothetical protein